jgi:hypothetical protein
LYAAAQSWASGWTEGTGKPDHPGEAIAGRDGSSSGERQAGREPQKQWNMFILI